ncbi:MAG: hypothetical protein JNM14_14210 [Ferruginibacter sp.]|nr:hypothetical protein [Ferruginibacter sp.]
MLRYLLLISCWLIGLCAMAQTDTLSKEDKRLLDSMFNNDEFIKLMMKKDRSYLEVKTGAGNQTISTSNNNVNAGELKSYLILTPAVNYHHKSGFGLAANAFLAVDSGNIKAYQFSINPYFEYFGKSFNAGIYYTRYISNESSGFTPNPFQNSFYGNVVYTKTYLAPGFAIGYNSGRFSDSVLILSRVRELEIKISDFNLSAYVLHEYYFNKLISKNDELTFTPSLILIAGRQQVKAPGLNNPRLSNFPRAKTYLKNRYESDSKFQMQSIAASATLHYRYKKFFIEPNFYIDYYLPATSYKKFTTVFSFSAGFIF